MFHIGDRVIAVAESHGWAGVEYGDEGIVQDVNEDTLGVIFNSRQYWVGTLDCFITVKEFSSRRTTPFLGSDEVAYWG